MLPNADYLYIKYRQVARCSDCKSHFAQRLGGNLFYLFHHYLSDSRFAIGIVRLNDVQTMLQRVLADTVSRVVDGAHHRGSVSLSGIYSRSGFSPRRSLCLCRWSRDIQCCSGVCRHLSLHLAGRICRQLIVGRRNEVSDAARPLLHVGSTIAAFHRDIVVGVSLCCGIDLPRSLLSVGTGESRVLYIYITAVSGSHAIVGDG